MTDSPAAKMRKPTMKTQKALVATLAIILSAGLLGGCMTSKSRSAAMSAAGWYKPDVDDYQRAKEVRYCRSSADREAARDYGYGADEGYRSHNDDGGGYRQTVTKYDAQRHRQDLYASCMRRYGYSYGKPKKPETEKP